MQGTRPRALGLILLTAGGGLIAACDSSEEMAAEDHTPVRFEMTVNGIAMADDTLRLSAGAVDTVRFTYYNAADDNLDSEESSHYSALAFPGGINATAATDSTAHYSQIVTNTETAGIVGVASVGYGHDAAADEANFTTPFKFE